jgi:hypothetical protein
MLKRITNWTAAGFILAVCLYLAGNFALYIGDCLETGDFSGLLMYSNSDHPENYYQQQNQGLTPDGRPAQ